MSPDDIPVVKDESTGEGKGNLVSITEEIQDSTEPSRVGSVRQSKDQKTASKITNFPVLGKKPKEKEGKVTKNVHALSEKEKKLGSQTTSKDSIKGSLSMLNNEQQQVEVEGNVNGCAIRKKNNSIENNAIIIDSNALIDSERLALNNENTDGNNIENSLNLRAHNETESMSSSIQVSSV